MTISFTTTVDHIGVGDQIISPITGKRMLVREVHRAPFGMIDFHCTDVDGDRLIVTLVENEEIKVIDA